MTAARIIRPATAFSAAKRPRQKAPDHCAYIRTLPCLITGVMGVECAHVRYGSLKHGKRPTGAGERPSDCWCVPLSPEQHRAQHAMGERAFWERVGIDPLDIALRLWAATGDEERGRLVIDQARIRAAGK